MQTGVTSSITILSRAVVPVFMIFTVCLFCYKQVSHDLKKQEMNIIFYIYIYVLASDSAVVS